VSFPRYPLYKDSGVEWLGEVPAHWDVKRLRYCVRLLTEKTDRRNFPVALENIEGWSGKFLPNENDYEADGVAFESNDILFGKLRPYLAKVLLTDRSGEAVGDFHVLRPKNSMIGRYCQYQMLNREFISIVDGSTYGAKMPRASWDFVGGVQFVAPPTDEQSTIAAFLDHETAKIDALVDEQKRLIELLKEKRQAVISHAVTKGLDPNVPMKDSGVEWLGEVPEHWKIVRLKHIAIAQGGSTPSKDRDEYWQGDIPWVSPKDMKADRLFDSIDHVSEEALVETGLSLVPIGAVLIVVRGMILAHSVPVAIAERELTINQDMKALIPSEKIMSEYLLRLIAGLKDVIFEYIDASAHGTRKIEWERLENMLIPLPPVTTQPELTHSIDQQLQLISRLSEKCTDAIHLLVERRTALISAAVTGKIDVRGWKPPKTASNALKTNQAKESA